jgi:hypothetical protein
MFYKKSRAKVGGKYKWFPRACVNKHTVNTQDLGEAISRRCYACGCACGDPFIARSHVVLYGERQQCPSGRAWLFLLQTELCGQRSGYARRGQQGASESCSRTVHP